MAPSRVRFVKLPSGLSLLPGGKQRPCVCTGDGVEQGTGLWFSVSRLSCRVPSLAAGDGPRGPMLDLKSVTDRRMAVNCLAVRRARPGARPMERRGVGRSRHGLPLCCPTVASGGRVSTRHAAGELSGAELPGAEAVGALWGLPSLLNWDRWSAERGLWFPHAPQLAVQGPQSPALLQPLCCSLSPVPHVGRAVGCLEMAETGVPWEFSLQPSGARDGSRPLSGSCTP